ncbi:MAG: CRISPR-associated helicase Cas3' [Clostridia bacterium]|nr:CRISPR-associated helicase Cas3' [Clostridia bacterium]
MTHSTAAGVMAQLLLDNFLNDTARQELAIALSLSESELHAFVGYLVALHDIGKLSTSFLWQISGNLKDEGALRTMLKKEGLVPRKASSTPVGHEVVSMDAASALWIERYPEKQVEAEFFAHILAAHHQRRHSVQRDQAHRAKWSEYRRQLESAMAAEFGWNQGLPEVQPGREAYVEVILNGLMIMADWIASGEAFVDADQWPVLNRDEILRRGRDFLQVSGLAADPVAIPDTFAAAWPAIGKSVRPLQAAVEKFFQEQDARTELLIIEAPMGDGKSEAALFGAGQLMKQWNKTGLYVALPTAATANQMYGRVLQFLRQFQAEADTKLLHAMAWLVDSGVTALGEAARTGPHDAALEAAAEWLKPVRRGLLSPFAVGTVDQVMMAAMFVRYGVLRLLGLENKVLIIDEIHAYDAYMQEILMDLLAWCRDLRIPVILLSATLTQEKKAELLAPYGASADADAGTDYPLITAVMESGEVKQVACEAGMVRQPITVSRAPILDDPNQIAQHAAEAVADGGCLVVIVNTVGQAQAVYESLKAVWDGELILFHARFPADQRAEIEKKCLALFGPDKADRPARAILVATQVVEQSLDVDFDVMMTANAPIDLILQRAGRLFRHAETPRPAHLLKPQLTVLTDSAGEYETDQNVYPLCLLHRSEAVLRETAQIQIPQDMRPLVEAGYSMDAAQAAELEEWVDNMMADEIKAGAAMNVRLGTPDYGFRPVREHPPYDDLESGACVAAKTRLGRPTVRVALLDSALVTELKTQADADGSIAVRNVAQARDILGRSVSVPESYMKTFKPELTGRGLLYGVQIYPAQDGVHEQNGHQIAYDRELGVIWRNV